MDHVKTFFKTLLWTLILLVLVVGGFWIYMKFFNQDMAAKVAGFIYKNEAVVECPVCPACEEVEAKECPTVATGDVAVNDDAEVKNEDTEEENVVDKKEETAPTPTSFEIPSEVTDQLDGLDSKMDQLIDMMSKLPVDAPKVEKEEQKEAKHESGAEKSDAEKMKDMMKRIEELENE